MCDITSLPFQNMNLTKSKSNSVFIIVKKSCVTSSHFYNLNLIRSKNNSLFASCNRGVSFNPLILGYNYSRVPLSG
jgi:hypothetical protein